METTVIEIARELRFLRDTCARLGDVDRLGLRGIGVGLVFESSDKWSLVWGDVADSPPYAIGFLLETDNDEECERLALSLLAEACGYVSYV